ncbi:hypothetical protein L3Q82_005469 [Scortum barcoo]|uniref:Uncharacterized protein n=1 Tax=Scortum barcoo TaxID=214431 RepID=A0ACB8VAN6_9TELE|nr:hypothetical protein L3Q82_005469 [Scortum barcoo]
MDVPELLLETLEDLINEDLQKLQWYLSLGIVEGYKAIPKSHLEKATRTETVTRLIQNYGDESAVKITVKILRKMNFNSTADELESKYAGKQASPAAAPPSAAAAPPAAAPPAAAPPASMSAQQVIRIMQAPLLLLDTLDELSAEEFKRFLWNLTQPVLDGCQPIRKGHLQSADRQDAVSKMIDGYGEESAVNVTVEILRRMNNNNTAENLKRQYAGGSTDAQKPLPASSSSPSSSPGLTPAAGATVCAQGKSVIVAPNIQGTSSGVSINMNINTQ